MPRKLNVAEDVKTFEKFHKDLGKFLEIHNLGLLDFARVLELPNNLLLYQWWNTCKYPYFFIFRCVQTFPSFFPICHYLDVEQLHFNFERTIRLKEEKRQRRIKKHSLPKTNNIKV